MNSVTYRKQQVERRRQQQQRKSMISLFIGVSGVLLLGAGVYFYIQQEPGVEAATEFTAADVAHEAPFVAEHEMTALASVSGFLAACNRGEPAIAVESAQLDLGNVPNGEIAMRDLTVHNTGDALLIVDDLTTSCGCTTAILEPMQLAPGENGVLHIEFDSGTHGQQLTGPLVRQVFINSNDPVQPEVTVELAANVTPSL